MKNCFDQKIAVFHQIPEREGFSDGTVGGSLERILERFLELSSMELW